MRVNGANFHMKETCVCKVRPEMPLRMCENLEVEQTWINWLNHEYANLYHFRRNMNMIEHAKKSFLKSIFHPFFFHKPAMNVRPCCSFSWPYLVAFWHPGLWQCFGIFYSQVMPRQKLRWEELSGKERSASWGVFLPENPWDFGRSTPRAPGCWLVTNEGLGWDSRS